MFHMSKIVTRIQVKYSLDVNSLDSINFDQTP